MPEWKATTATENPTATGENEQTRLRTGREVPVQPETRLTWFDSTLLTSKHHAYVNNNRKDPT
jgi:hypothetical protein